MEQAPKPFIPQVGPDKATEIFYLRKIEVNGGLDIGTLTGENLTDADIAGFSSAPSVPDVRPSAGPSRKRPPVSRRDRKRQQQRPSLQTSHPGNIESEPTGEAEELTLEEVQERYRDESIARVIEAYDAYKASGDAGRIYMNTTWADYNKRWRAWAQFQNGEPPKQPARPDVLTRQQKELVNEFVPGSFPLDGVKLSRDEGLRQGILRGERAAQFARAAAALADTEARYGNEPGSHTPTILPALTEWFDGYDHQGPTHQLVIGTASTTTPDSYARMIHSLDTDAQVDAIDIEPLLLPPLGDEGQGEGAYTFTQGNAFGLSGMFGRNSLDAIHEHLLFIGASQLQQAEMGYNDQAGDVETYPVPEDQKTEFVPKILKQMHTVLRPGAVATMMERIDPTDDTAVNQFIEMLVQAGFQRQDIQTVRPTRRFRSRRDADAALAGGLHDLNAFIAERDAQRGEPSVVDDVDYEPTTLFIATKAASKGLFGGFLSRRG